MRTTIQRWHVGQLLMAWVGGIIVAAMLVAVGSFALQVRRERQDVLAYREGALEKLARDSAARSDSTLTKARFDTLAALERMDSDSARRRAWDLEASWGYMNRSDFDAAYEKLDSNPAISTMPMTALAALAGGAVLTILAFLWWATWVWFAGRARPAPPPSTG